MMPAQLAATPATTATPGPPTPASAAYYSCASDVADEDDLALLAAEAGIALPCLGPLPMQPLAPVLSPPQHEGNAMAPVGDYPASRVAMTPEARHDSPSAATSPPTQSMRTDNLLLDNRTKANAPLQPPEPPCNSFGPLAAAAGLLEVSMLLEPVRPADMRAAAHSPPFSPCRLGVADASKKDGFSAPLEVFAHTYSPPTCDGPQLPQQQAGVTYSAWRSLFAVHSGGNPPSEPAAAQSAAMPAMPVEGCTNLIDFTPFAMANSTLSTPAHQYGASQAILTAAVSDDGAPETAGGSSAQATPERPPLAAAAPLSPARASSQQTVRCTTQDAFTSSAAHLLTLNASSSDGRVCSGHQRFRRQSRAQYFGNLAHVCCRKSLTEP